MQICSCCILHSCMWYMHKQAVLPSAYIRALCWVQSCFWSVLFAYHSLCTRVNVPHCLQVAALRCRCLRQILATIDESTILEYLQAADLVSDSELMSGCLRLWGQPEFRYVSHCCSACRAMLLPLPVLHADGAF